MLNKKNEYEFLRSLLTIDNNIAKKKLIGSLIFRGNKSRAIKMFDEVLYQLKMHFGCDPHLILNKVFKILLPIFGVTYKRFGGKYQVIPTLINNRRKYVLIIDWLVRNLKGKSNIRGININNLVNIIIDTYNGKGNALISKKKYNDYVLQGRFFLDSSSDYYKQIVYEEKKKKYMQIKNVKEKRKRKRKSF